jgi:hypothetical protein
MISCRSTALIVRSGLPPPPAVLLCRRACHRKDWKEHQHKKICELLNVGHGDMQLRSNIHTNQQIVLIERHEGVKQSLFEEGVKLFFKLFHESTLEGSRAAAQKMKKFAKRQNIVSTTRRFFCFTVYSFLLALTRKCFRGQTNSPLLVFLQFVYPDVLSRGENA